MTNSYLVSWGKAGSNHKSCKTKQIQDILASQCQCCFRVSVPSAKASKAQQNWWRIRVKQDAPRKIKEQAFGDNDLVSEDYLLRTIHEPVIAISFRVLWMN